MSGFHVFLQKEGASARSEQKHTTLGTLLGLSGGNEVEEGDDMLQDPTRYNFRFRTHDTEIILGGPDTPIELTDDINQCVYWEKKDARVRVAEGALLIVKGRPFDLDKVEHHYPHIGGVLVPVRATGDEVVQCVANRLGVGVTNVTNLYREDIELNPTFENDDDRSRRRYVDEWSDDGFDIGFIEVADTDEVRGAIVRIAARQALWHPRLRGMAELFGTGVALEALGKAAREIIGSDPRS